MTEKKIRVWLTMSVIAVTIILFAFIWAINLNQTEELKNILRMYIIVLGIFVVFAMSLFFLFGEIFDYHGELEKSKVLLMTIIMLLIAQIAFAFTTFTSQQTQFTFKTMELSRKIYDDASKKEIFTLDDNDAIKNYFVEQLDNNPEFDAIVLIDKDNKVFASDGSFEVGYMLEPDVLSWHIIPLGNKKGSFIIRDSEEYQRKITSDIISELLTIMAASIFLTIELMLFAMKLLDDKINPPKSIDGVESLTALRYVRQIAFLFYFASCLPSAFISVMANKLGGSLFGITGSVLSGIPQSAETLLTCSAIFLTARLIEKKGWKVPFFVGLILVALGNLATAFAGTILLFILARALTGLGYGFCWMTLRNFALFGRNEEEKSEGFSLLNAGLYAGINCGSVLGSILADKVGYQIVLVISAVFTALCVVSILKIENRLYVKASVHESKSNANIKVGVRDVLRLILFIILMITPTCIAGAFLSYYLPLYFTGTGRGVADVGRAQLLYGLFVIYLGPAISKATSKNAKIPFWNALYNIIVGVGFVLFGIFNSYYMAYVCVIFLSFADSFGFVVQNNYFLLEFPIVQKMGASRAMSVLSFTKKMAEMLGPITFGIVIAQGSPLALATLGAIFVTAVIIFTISEIRGKVKVEA